MKKISFKRFIKKFVTLFASREFAFVYCLLGTFGQVAHCYYLLNNVSSFDGWFKTFQAVLLSLFISSSLLYFVSIADKDEEEKEYKRIMSAVNLFMVIEILINIYYYARFLLMNDKGVRIVDFLFATMVAVLIPITIKFYANSIKAKQWFKELEGDESNSNPEILDSIKQEIDNLKNNQVSNTIIEQKVDTILKEKSEEFDENIGNLLSERLGLFEQQFSNKMDDKMRILKDINNNRDNNGR